jgi:hypothetical protein
MVEGAVRPLAPEADCVVLCQLVRGKGWHVTSNWRAATRRRSPVRNTAAAKRLRLSRR